MPLGGFACRVFFLVDTQFIVFIAKNAMFNIFMTTYLSTHHTHARALATFIASKKRSKGVNNPVILIK